MNKSSLVFLSERLGKDETKAIYSMAEKAQSIEDKYKRKTDTVWNKIFDQAFESVKEGNPVEIDDELEKLFTEHFFEVCKEAYRSTKKDKTITMARGGIPRTLKDLMRVWDIWKKKKKAPQQQAAYARKIKEAYIQKLQETWKKYREKWESGEESKEEIKKKIKKEANTTQSRANNIIETENTRYWNQTRRQIYDSSPVISHYLYMPVRDMATTPWCFPGIKSPRTRSEAKLNPRGLRGRGRLVYRKDDPELDNVCPSHWNCRSELVPLTPANPRHKQMIEDKTLARRSHECVPLPRGW